MSVRNGLPKPKKPGILPGNAKHLSAFARDEEGSLLIFAVYVFVLMLMVGGIGIDLMRFERDRSELQYTLDRAVLAAADLEQTLDPTDVVQDYFDKAGLGSYLRDVTVEEGLGYRVVTANAEAEVYTQFMHMTGLDMLSAPATSVAEERIDSVEISLVLDVSGSMNSNNRLTNLKIAARDFVDTMVDNTEDGKMSISIIPYATQVSLPDGVASRLNLSDEHNYSRCVNFEASDFDETSVTTTQALERTMHFDPCKTWDGRDNDPMEMVGLDNGLNSTLPVCEAMANRELIVMQKDKNTLKNYISALTARGNTSIDVGMKWGTALLDPAFRPVVNGLIADGDVPGEFAARPYNYDSGEVLKVVVLMTDGQNTSQYYIHDDYRGGDSNVWWNESAERYSVYYSAYNAYYWEHNDKWADHPYGQDGWGCVGNSTSSWSCQNRTESGEAVRLDYADLWAWTTMKRVAKYVYRNYNSDWNEIYYGPRKYVNSGTKNNRAYDICDAAKDQDIIVFTIGFEAPSSGRTVLRNCASSEAHYFDVDGLEIADAFDSIATSIRKLRLTQ